MFQKDFLKDYFNSANLMAIIELGPCLIAYDTSMKI